VGTVESSPLLLSVTLETPPHDPWERGGPAPSRVSLHARVLVAVCARACAPVCVWVALWVHLWAGACANVSLHAQLHISVCEAGLTPGSVRACGMLACMPPSTSDMNVCGVLAKYTTGSPIL